MNLARYFEVPDYNPHMVVGILLYLKSLVYDENYHNQSGISLPTTFEHKTQIRGLLLVVRPGVFLHDRKLWYNFNLYVEFHNKKIIVITMQRQQ